MTPDRESRLEAALAALLAEVVNMREDYPAEAWRFSDEADQFEEWVEFNVGHRGGLSEDNPLADIDMEARVREISK
ncbi:hypothetical protein CDI98_20125 [Salmonella enterica subsp. enterica serovar Newport]|nr:hypothetical protein [Salmonella enterica subsp. enterica serovar Newport]